MSCEHFNFKLNKLDRYYIDSKEHNNCVLCLINEKGKMTLDEIAKYFKLSRMRVCQIEKKATKKVMKRLSYVD